MGRPKGSLNKVKSSSTMKKREEKKKEYKKCSKCLEDKELDEFYQSYNPYHADGKIPYCYDCIQPEDENNQEQVKEKLRMIDRPFILDRWDSTKNGVNVSVKKQRIFGNYLKNLNLNKGTQALTYNDSDFTLKENLENQTDDTQDKKSAEVEIGFDSEDAKSKQDCIRLLGYDPFAGYELSDQRILYNELLPYLDEDTLEDQYKIQVIIQILNNNIQIRKIDLTINSLGSNSETLLKNAATIKSLTTTKKEIATNSDKLAKENAIAIKHRGDKKAGQSTLGGIMKTLRELGFEKAEENYYDMKKAYGMRVTADISNKSILDQLNFDEKDIEDMFKDQRNLIVELQDKVEELEEKLRIANVALKSGGGINEKEN